MLRLLSTIYEYVVRKKNLSFDKKQRETFHVDVPVISVGNISVGGAGKTPFVKMLVKMLLDMGKKPAIIGRGYKKKIKGIVYVSDGITINYTPEECGDEMYLLAEALRVPVIAHEVKYEAALKAVEIFDIDSLVVDDGFQHRLLHRDMDIVLLDNRTLEQHHLLPYGRLREPLESLKRADFVCFRNDISLGQLSKYTLQYTENLVYKYDTLRPFRLSNNTSPDGQEIYDLRKGAVALSGIANPRSFEETLKNDGFNIVSHIAMPDHYKYKRKSVEKIVSQCLAYNLINIITTEKDSVKLKYFENIFEKNNINVYVLPINVSIEKGQTLLEERIYGLFNNE